MSKSSAYGSPVNIGRFDNENLLECMGPPLYTKFQKIEEQTNFAFLPAWSMDLFILQPEPICLKIEEWVPADC